MSSPQSPNGLEGNSGSRVQLRSPNKESGDSVHMEMEGNDSSAARNNGEQITGKPISGLRRHYGDSGQIKKDLAPFSEPLLKEPDSGGSLNIYVGQWDAIKERMVWGIMERDKEASSNKFGLIEYTSL